MKKELSVFLCAAALFFSSCADLSVDNEAALKADLPKDFNWRVYAEINGDIYAGQVILAIRNRNNEFKNNSTGTTTALIRLDSAKQATPNCVKLLKDESLAEEVYLRYAQCPKEGWYKDDKCTGIYSNNYNYSRAITQTTPKDTIIDGKDTTVNRLDTMGFRCVIGGCWRGGWDIISAKDAECIGDEEADAGKDCFLKGSGFMDTATKQTLLLPLREFLQDSLEAYNSRVQTATAIGTIRTFDPIGILCGFMPKAENSTEALSYLKNIELDSILVQEHYHALGRYDGRPYKYCEPEEIGEEKSIRIATARSNYYDYGAYTFCLNKEDQKIYSINSAK